MRVMCRTMVHMETTTDTLHLTLTDADGNNLGTLTTTLEALSRASRDSLEASSLAGQLARQAGLRPF